MLTGILLFTGCGDDDPGSDSDGSSTSGGTTTYTSTSSATTGIDSTSTGGSTNTTGMAGTTSSTTTASTTGTESATGESDTGPTSGDADASSTGAETSGTPEDGDSTGDTPDESTSTTAMESSSGGEVAEFSCPTGCAAVFTPLTGVDMGTEFEINYGDDGAVDMRDTVITFTLHVETDGNAGGLQLYAKNGSRQSYRSHYGGWTNLPDATSGFIDVTLDLRNVPLPEGSDDGGDESGDGTGTGGDMGSGSDSGTGGGMESGSESGTGGGTGFGSEAGTGTGGESGDMGTGGSTGSAEGGGDDGDPPPVVFDKTDVVYVGLQVLGGSSVWPDAVWGDTTVYIDSITFSNGVRSDHTFETGAEGMEINVFNNPIAGSEVFYQAE